ncbi:MAG: Gfo/Idh/MocA family oxidoreductase [Planctomycetes bacterium]|nr:Gfo/Idh/MocA family oxidoreductase [Planctomycetota bacterium]
MMTMARDGDGGSVSRRGALGVVAATVGTAATVLAADSPAADSPAADPIAKVANVAGSDRVKVGLVGCGGRGSGAALQAMNADPGMVLWALADPFPDRVQSGANVLARAVEEKVQKDAAYKERFNCPPERQFTGLDGYQAVIDSCDVVLLASPPAFRPAHLAEAVKAGRHVFCEKPMAVDAAGLRSVRDTVALSKKGDRSLVAGFCWRYSARERDVYRRIHEGAIGPVRATYTTYNAAGFRGENPRQPDWSDLEYYIRNWPYYTWLSGDHIVEQAVHAIDKIAWAMADEPPLSVTCTGGREVRPDVPVGNNIFDHFGATFEYSGGRRGFHMCRHFPGAANDNSDFVIGATGHALVNGFGGVHKIVLGGTTWESEVERNDMYQQEHDELFKSIRDGKPLNDGDRMTNSTAMAIMARMSAYTGQPVTWEQLWASKEDLAPPTWEFGPVIPPTPIAVPGKTKLV